MTTHLAAQHKICRVRFWTIRQNRLSLNFDLEWKTLIVWHCVLELLATGRVAILDFTAISIDPGWCSIELAL